MKALQRSEFDDQPEEQYRAIVWRELEWIRLANKRKPGWTYYAFVEAFGVKPDRWMSDLTPVEPSRELLLWLNRRNAAFKREKRRNGNGRGKAPSRSAGATEEGKAHRGNGYVED